MSKVFMGARLQRLREQHGMTQAALARTLGISPSYLNQMERNQRPLTVPILLRISDVMQVDPQLFSEHDSATLVADVRDVLSDLPGSEPPSLAELKLLVENMPDMARAMLRLQRRYRMAAERAEALEARFDSGGPMDGALPPSADEEVRDYLNRRQNYIGELDEAAEAMGAGGGGEALRLRLRQQHGVTVLSAPDTGAPLQKRRYDAQQRLLWLPGSMSAGQQAFQMAAQVGLLEHGAVIDALVAQAGLSGEPARAGLHLALSNYYAGAALMPYAVFLQAAEAHAYDIDLLAHRFSVGFEAVCHRLSTMQRPGRNGLPVFFVRVDRAGNVSKRQSATAFHFSRVGGTCPLWVVYEAFSQPGRILRQIARMPDGGSHLWIARHVSTGPAGFMAPGRSFAIALGCDISQAHRMIYAKGLDLHDPGVATAIGTGCKVCERDACPQRAFPSILRKPIW